MAEITEQNPMGTDGFEFVEFTAPDPALLEGVLKRLGFAPVARHRSKQVVLWRQGDINFIVNAEPGSEAAKFAAAHGPSANAMAFRVKDAAHAYQRALSLGAKPFVGKVGATELNIPAIEGIGGSALYFVDRYGDRTIYDVDFEFFADPNVPGVGLNVIDHLTHNLRQGEMDTWYGFYNKLFNFREIRFFDIEGKLTALRSRALTSPCGKIKIPLNESAGGERKDQIQEFIEQYNGEGIQHIAMATSDIFGTVKDLRAQGLGFMDAPPDTYYEMLDERLPGHGEDVAALKQNSLLMDGTTEGQNKLLLQIFSETVVGPIFFEIIQRKGDDGFGEGNFKALFESIERDQIKRGVLQDVA
ncbi:MAG: hppD [Rhodospirillales bacterium]|nr:hppD [Rhodospirillales bacterium]